MVVQADEIVCDTYIDASPATVFSFFTDKDMIPRWKGDWAEVDPRPGGLYRIGFANGQVASGEYQEVVPDQRVVFTWGWEDGQIPVAPGSSTVEVTLTPEGTGTRLVLVHRDLPQAARDLHDEGWMHFLERLRVAAPGGDPGPDPWHDEKARAEGG